VIKMSHSIKNDSKGHFLIDKTYLSMVECKYDEKRGKYVY